MGLHAGHVKEIQWSFSDSYLITQCTQGLLKIWTVENATLMKDFQYKYKNILCYACDLEYDLVIASCADMFLRVFSINEAQELEQEINTAPYLFTTALISPKNKVLFLGSNLGTVRVYLWPPTDYAIVDPEFYDINVHQGPVGSMKLSGDQMFLITGGDDGTINFHLIS